MYEDWYRLLTFPALTSVASCLDSLPRNFQLIPGSKLAPLVSILSHSSPRVNHTDWLLDCAALFPNLTSLDYKFINIATAMDYAAISGLKSLENLRITANGRSFKFENLILPRSLLSYTLVIPPEDFPSLRSFPRSLNQLTLQSYPSATVEEYYIRLAPPSFPGCSIRYNDVDKFFKIKLPEYLTYDCILTTNNENSVMKLLNLGNCLIVCLFVCFVSSYFSTQIL